MMNGAERARRTKRGVSGNEDLTSMWHGTFFHSDSSG